MAKPVLHRQPFRLLYLVYFAAKTLLVKIPLWTLMSLRRSQRPRRSWSIGRCVRVYVLRAVITLPTKVGIWPGKRDLSKEVQDSTLRNAKFAWVDGIEAEVLKGAVREMAEKAGIKPQRIPGYWQLKVGSDWTPRAKEGEKVVYHLHGGAFIISSAHPSDATAPIPRGILEHSETVARTFAVEYRLSSSAPFPAENPFPAALLDSIAGYRYLIGLGFQPENVVLVGDSAGGNLALALVRYLTAYPVANLPPPGRLILLSPWGDLSTSRTGPGTSMVVNNGTDMFPVNLPGKNEFGAYGAKSYIGTAQNDEEGKRNKYLSPSSPHLSGVEGMFSKFPKTYIVAGGAEVSLDDSKVIAERMRADSGQEDWVRLDVAEDAVHDFCIFPWHEPERTEALGRMSRWIDED